jgi:DNA-binding response OmpR family regulator
MAHILVVDDDNTAAQAIAQVLQEDGHVVSRASNGVEALDMLAHLRPDLLILDIVMPEMDGLETCRRIRADPFLAKLPVLFLTSKGRPKDIALGLDAGGDDFVTKPFATVELPARVRALLRRASGGALDPASEYLTVGDLKVHPTRFEVRVRDELVWLTPLEHRLLHYLMMHAGRPVSAEQLLEDIWEYAPGTGDPKLVRVHVANLRSKIELEPDSPQYIRNVRGRGYMIDR